MIVTEGKTYPRFLLELDHKRMSAPGDMFPLYKDTEFEDLPKAPEPLGKSVEINIFVDASHGDNQQDRKSTTGLLIFIGDMLYKVKSKRQKCVATSTFSAEFMALRYAYEEGLSVKFLLQSLGVPISGKINIYSDNKSILESSVTPGIDLKRKHVAIAFHAVREAYAHDVISLHWISGSDNPADFLTKALGNIIYEKHSNCIFGSIKLIEERFKEFLKEKRENYNSKKKKNN